MRFRALGIEVNYLESVEIRTRMRTVKNKTVLENSRKNKIIKMYSRKTTGWNKCQDIIALL